MPCCLVSSWTDVGGPVDRTAAALSRQVDTRIADLSEL
jgi:hypothetical protein